MSDSAQLEVILPSSLSLLCLQEIGTGETHVEFVRSLPFFLSSYLSFSLSTLSPNPPSFLPSSCLVSSSRPRSGLSFLSSLILAFFTLLWPSFSPSQSPVSSSLPPSAFTPLYSLPGVGCWGPLVRWTTPCPHSLLVPPGDKTWLLMPRTVWGGVRLCMRPSHFYLYLPTYSWGLVLICFYLYLFELFLKIIYALSLVFFLIILMQTENVTFT